MSCFELTRFASACFDPPAGDLFQELAGRPPGDKDQLEVLGAGAHQYSFQYAYRESSRTSTLAVSPPALGVSRSTQACGMRGGCSRAWVIPALHGFKAFSWATRSTPAGCRDCLQGADLRRWVTDTGARRGDSIALQRSGNAVHVQHIPAGGRGKGTSGSLSPSPASAAAQAGGAVRPHGNRKSTEQSEQQGGAAAAAAAGGGSKGSRRPSHEQQEQLDGQASAAAAADGGRKGGKRPSGAEEAGGSAAATAGAASPAEAAGGDDHLSPGGGSSSVPKGWHQDADGWWRRTLTATACRRARLGMQRKLLTLWDRALLHRLCQRVLACHAISARCLDRFLASCCDLAIAPCCPVFLPRRHDVQSVDRAPARGRG